MVFDVKRTSYQETRRRMDKIFVGFFVLIYTATEIVAGNDDIPFCKDRMVELRRDEKSWLQRCVDDKGQVLDTTCCEVEKNYNLQRMCMDTKMCFNTGNT